MFLTLMVIGLAGLVVMALPALGGHGHGYGHGYGHAHSGVAHHAPFDLVVSKLGTLLKGKGGPPRLNGATPSLAFLFLRFLPSPRLVFSLLALYGACGNALVHAGHFRPVVAALLAVLPALIVERFAVTPLWNLAFRFQAQPSSPLGALVLGEAKAVTPFRNGRGVVAVVRDGRLVQFSANLVEGQSKTPVRVGDPLLVEDVDPDRERLMVSVPNGNSDSQA
jgi:hypothetical protein